MPEQAKLFEYSNVPITATEIFNRIMVIGPQEGVKKLPKKNLTKWLISLGFLEEVMVNEARVKRPTESGKEIGILQEERRGQYGNYFVVLYNRDAQQFIIDNLDAVIEHNKVRFDKPLEASKEGVGTIAHISVKNRDREISQIIKDLKAKQKAGTSLDDTAILYRTNNQANRQT